MSRNYEKEAEWEKQKYKKLVAKIDRQVAEEFLNTLDKPFAVWLKEEINKYLKEYKKMRKNEFNFEENLGKQVYVVGQDFKGIQQDYTVFYNLEEAKKYFHMLDDKNIDKNWSHTLDKCIVRKDELECIDNIY